MQRIAVLGSSLAGIKMIEEIRKQDNASEITLFTLDGKLPYYRHLLADFVSGEVSGEEIYYQPKEYYEKLSVILCDEKIVKVSFKRNYVTTEAKQRCDFDVLVITDTPAAKFPDIKGTNKTGVFSLNRLSDIQHLCEALLTIDSVVVQGGGEAGLKMVRALKTRKKEVLWIVPDTESLPGGEEIRLIQDNAVEELLGDSDVKAIRLKSGKVIAAQAVIFGDTQGDFRLFKDSGIQIADKIAVNENFQTHLAHVFALNGACASGQGEGLSVLEQQGKTVAAYLQQQADSATPAPADSLPA